MSRLRRRLKHLPVLAAFLLAAASAPAAGIVETGSLPRVESLQERLATLDAAWAALRAGLPGPELLSAEVSPALAAALVELGACRCSAGGRADAAALGATLAAAAKEAGADPQALAAWNDALRDRLVPLTVALVPPPVGPAAVSVGPSPSEWHHLLHASPPPTRAALREGLRELRPGLLRGLDDSQVDGLLTRWLRAAEKTRPKEGLLLRLRAGVAPGLAESPR